MEEYIVQVNSPEFPIKPTIFVVLKIIIVMLYRTKHVLLAMSEIFQVDAIIFQNNQ
jgi:hypothetical protein